MKKAHILSIILSLSAFCSCREDKFVYDDTGVLSLSDFSLNTSMEVNPKSDALEDDYMVFIYSRENGELVYKNTYAEIKTVSNITLKAGKYTLEARNHEDIPLAEFDRPVYGDSKDFTIVANQTSRIGTLTCTLRQCAVSIKYNDGFLLSVTGNGVTSVEVKSGASLDYPIIYNENTGVSFDERIGYFSLDKDETSTMIVIYKGYIDGNMQKMTTILSGVKAKDYHVITLVKNISESGNASFGIYIDGLIFDSVLDDNV